MEGLPIFTGRNPLGFAFRDMVVTLQNDRMVGVEW